MCSVTKVADNKSGIIKVNVSMFCFQIQALEDKTCTLLCEAGKPKTLTAKEAKILVDLIKNDYYVHL